MKATNGLRREGKERRLREKIEEIGKAMIRGLKVETLIMRIILG